MRWLMRDLWKAGIAIAGILLLLVLTVWLPVSAAGAHERGPGLATRVTVQTTPTEDATVTELNKEKLAQEVKQLKNQNEPNFFDWLRGNASILLSTLLVVVGGVFGLVRYLAERRDAQKHLLEDRQAERDRRDEEQQRWLKDQEAEREKRAEERFQAVVEGLGSEREEAKVGAAITLRTFLRPGYEQFYTQVFDLAIAHLRLSRTTHPSEDPDGTTHPSEDPNTPLPLTTLRQALVAVFKEAFPLARDSNSSGKEGAVQSLDATAVLLDNAYLVGADLERVWMPQASLREVKLEKANLRKTNLLDANLRGADLLDADLSGADLSGADLSGADLRRVELSKATLRGTNLSGAKFFGANLSEAQLYFANLSGANLDEVNLSKAILMRANLSQANLSRTDLSEAFLPEANLSEADLSGVSLGGADLMNANLEGVDLSLVSSLDKVNLSGANLSRTNLKAVQFLEGVVLSKVKGLTKEQLETCKAKGAIIDEDPTTSSSQSTVSPPTPSQSNDIQAPLAPYAQGSTPTSNADSSSATYSKPGPES